MCIEKSKKNFISSVTQTKIFFYIFRSSPSDRHLLLGMNYSEKLSRTHSNVRFQQLLSSARQKHWKCRNRLFWKISHRGRHRCTGITVDGAAESLVNLAKLCQVTDPRESDRPAKHPNSPDYSKQENLLYESLRSFSARENSRESTCASYLISYMNLWDPKPG